MVKKERISTLWFTLPILGLIFPAFGIVILCVYGFLAIAFIVELVKLLVRGDFMKPETEPPSGRP